MTGGAQHHYPTLDGMRGVAAIGVLVYHFGDLLPVPLFRAGYLAVDLFFCLSGFVIAHAYEARLRAGMTIGRFALIRLIRLWPLVALGVALGAAQAWLLPATADPALLAATAPVVILLNLLLLPSFVGDGPRLFPANPPHWSLFYEMAVNLAYAALSRRLSNRLLLLLILGGFALFCGGIATLGTANIGWARDQIPFGIGRVTCTFLSGVLLHRCRERLDAPRLAGCWWLALLLTAAALTLPVGSVLRPIFDAMFVLAGGPLLIWLAMAARPPQAALPVLSGLGRLSYPLYALHFPLYLAAAELASRFPSLRGLVAVTAMVIACGGALLLARLYDEPVRRRLTALFIISPQWGSRRPPP
ncbi:acyltransferase family protein [Rhizorhabdus dicambivorans]|uniref:Acyltransferase n=1 Tax=Rhizorhabdus dicambivorans TaxID=1850238 RepID=A0A2A4FU63_9SPHN|nr:acyltransferase [Rhizorhabdus dicambivorans]ATE64407.1 acyltransferase [Rhizorhabdus dicambivorans]PCE41244.1 acyltransferase [Rhizorhabdus dicambivorans]